jgi:putative drug exporter of the RND superfamily
MIGRLAHLMYRRRWSVIGAWVFVLVVAGIFAAQASSLLGAPDYSDPGSQSARAGAVLDRTFHQNGQKTTLVILTSKTLTADQASFRAPVARLAARLLADRALHFNAVDNPLVTHNLQGISHDRHSVVLSASTTLDENGMEHQVDHLQSVTRVPGFTTRLTGYSVISQEGNVTATRDLSRAETFTLPILLVILLLVFGAVVAAALPFLIAIVSIVVCLACIWVGAHLMSMSVYVLDVVTFIGLGISIDYSLFIVYRFREELARGNDCETAVVRSMETTGRAIFFSGLAVAVGLSSLLLTGLPFMQAMGLGGMLIPLATLVVTLTLLPAVLGTLGPRVNRLRVMPERWLRPSDGGAWRTIGLAIMRRPWLTGGAVLVVMVLLALPAARLTLSQGTLKQENGPAPAVLAMEYLQQHFTIGSDPFTVVVQGPDSLLNSQSLSALKRMESTIRQDPEVSQVYGLADVVAPGGRVTPATHRFLSANSTTALIIAVPRDDGTTARNMAGLRRIRTIAGNAMNTDLKGTNILVGGSSAWLVDFDSVITSRLPVIALVVLGLTYLFLFLAFRTVFLPLKAVALNVLSVGAAFGMLQLVFQEGFGVSVLGTTEADGIPTWVLLFLFAFLFGLSMDYEVLLLSRIREAWLLTGDNAESVVTGLARTGRLISSAAVIMAIAFSGFMLGSALWMKEMGFGLTVSILVDATLIRVVLVPSIMAIMGRWNWWVPRSLRAWSRRGGIDRDETPEEVREPVLA